VGWFRLGFLLISYLLSELQVLFCRDANHYVKLYWGEICLLVVIFFFFFFFFFAWIGAAYGHEEFFLFRGVGGLVFCLCAFGSNS
jgi:hypothetical protein